MHRLDSYINDIEPRIKAIYENVPKQEEPSLQESLASYGWILLDAWVAWRTLRFLLRETYIEDSVHDKWFQTPSSYTASQLMSVWKFNVQTRTYIKRLTGKRFKELIDQTIQTKRNSSAHFSKKSVVTGADSQEIKKYFQTLSTVFLFYETGKFLKNICYIFEEKGYQSFRISYSKDEIYDIEGFFDNIESYSQHKCFIMTCNDKNNKEYVILFEKTGCKAGKMDSSLETSNLHDVVNSEQAIYNFFGNKGFYQKTDLFVRTVEECWNKES